MESMVWAMEDDEVMRSPYSMYLRETFCDCLVLIVRMYICSAASRRAVSYFNSDPNLSNTTSLQLWWTRTEKETEREGERESERDRESELERERRRGRDREREIEREGDRRIGREGNREGHRGRGRVKEKQGERGIQRERG